MKQTIAYDKMVMDAIERDKARAKVVDMSNRGAPASMVVRGADGKEIKLRLYGR